MRFLVAFLLIYFYSSVHGQEICNNYIDDDGDGLIDCYDNDCYCHETCEDHYLDECRDSCLGPIKIESLQLKESWRFRSKWHSYNLNITGDIDNDGIPEIISKANANRAGTAVQYRQLLVVSGLTGALKYQIDIEPMRWSSSGVTIGDLDRNGLKEILHISSDFGAAETWGQIHCYEFTGTNFVKKWVTNEGAHYVNHSIRTRYKPQLADFNGDGIGEVYVLDKIYSGIDGTLILETGDEEYLGKLIAQPFSMQHTSAADILPDDACLDCDGLELITGGKIYSVYIDPNQSSLSRITEEKVCPGQVDGYTAIVDIDHDGDLDIVITRAINSNQSEIITWDGQENKLLCPSYILNSENGSIGVPCLDDFNGNGIMEMAIITSRRFSLLEFDATGWKLQWYKQTTDPSGQTGCTAFDFNADGFSEIIYRDETELRIFEAASGKELFTAGCTSGTGDDYPIVVDADGDGEAELLVSCGNDLVCYESANIKWQNTRSVWNQYQFFNTNINDDLTLPLYNQNRSLLYSEPRLNNFLVPYSTASAPAPDYTIEIIKSSCSNGERVLLVQICNQGETVSHDSLFVTFYDRNPLLFPTTKKISRYISNPIKSDSCSVISITGSFDDTVFAVINDKGDYKTPFRTDFGQFYECKYDNNLDSAIFEFNQGLLLKATNTYLCNTDSVTLIATGSYSSGRWSNGASEDTILVNTPGWYYFSAYDSCGLVIRDSIQVQDENPVITNTIFICPGDSLLSNNNWHFAGDIDSTIRTGTICDTLVIVEYIDYSIEHPLFTTAPSCINNATGQIVFDSLSSNFRVIWDDGPSGYSRNYLSPGEYTPIIVDSNQCKQELDISIGAIELEFNYNLDTASCLNQFNNIISWQETPGVQYSFNDSIIIERNNFSTKEFDITIILEKLGCSDTVLININNIDTHSWHLPSIVDLPCSDTSSIIFEKDTPSGNILYVVISNDTLDLGSDNKVIIPKSMIGDQLLIWRDDRGCLDSSNITIRRSGEENIFIPNVFTPNGDQINDIFTVFLSPCLREIASMEIYDRWGELLFQQYDFDPNSSGWNGKLNGVEMMPGVYSYSISTINLKGEINWHRGTVTLLR